MFPGVSGYSQGQYQSAPWQQSQQGGYGGGYLQQGFPPPPPPLMNQQDQGQFPGFGGPGGFDRGGYGAPQGGFDGFQGGGYGAPRGGFGMPPMGGPGGFGFGGPGGLGGPGGQRPDLKTLLSGADTNADGVISKDEFLAFTPQLPTVNGQQPPAPSDAIKQNMFTKLDGNGDGSVSQDELANARPPMPHRPPFGHQLGGPGGFGLGGPGGLGGQRPDLKTLLNGADTNADGTISKDEFLAFTPQTPAIGGQQPPAPTAEMKQNMFTKLDANADGSVSQDELANARPPLPPPPPFGQQGQGQFPGFPPPPPFGQFPGAGQGGGYQNTGAYGSQSGYGGLQGLQGGFGNLLSSLQSMLSSLQAGGTAA